ncbi:MAG TPA: 2-oxo acid dehydrogenase subunit E2 [Verrucomicrobiae bacterium]|nr:2-oxo acid dehydrogenase subunit E2 [Verrucomicrobiae bacterium]
MKTSVRSSPPAGPAFRESQWPLLRNALLSYLDSSRSHVVHGMIEMDVTEALQAIRRIERELRIAVSFHAFLLHSLVQAAMRHPTVVTYRRGNKLLTFEDIDVLTPIEKRLPHGVRIPVAHIVRAAQQKSLAQINWELRSAIRAGDLAGEEAIRLRRRFARMPAFIRGLVSWRVKRDPFLLKKLHGTVLLTNVQSRGLANACSVLGLTVHTLSLGAGSITDRVKLDQRGVPVNRRILMLSGSADHDIVDGMVASRFIAQMTRLVESAAGLDSGFVAETRLLQRQESHGNVQTPVYA